LPPRACLCACRWCRRRDLRRNAPAAAGARSEELRNALGFETGTPGKALPKWGGTPGAVFVDAEVHHRGTRAARVDQRPLANIGRSIPIGAQDRTLDTGAFAATEANVRSILLSIYKHSGETVE